MKKRIGCVVIMHPGQNNYGSSLQGFATINKIESLGYDCEIIRYNKKRSLKSTLPDAMGLIRSGAVGNVFYRLSKIINFKLHPEYTRTYRIRTAAVNAFKSKYLDSKSRFYTGYDELKKGSLNYSCVMVGSDQVWGPLSLYSRFYNLLFVDKSIPTFSYASSFGVSTIFPWQKEEVAKYLNKLTRIGLREQRGKEIVKELTLRDDAQVVVDPTFLLTQEEWARNIDESRCKIDEPYILTYVLGEREDIREEIKKMRQKSGVKIVNLPHIDNYHSFDDELGDINLYDVDPFDFIRLVRDAKYVVTDSFHGSVFSILFQKKFMTFYRKDPNAKGSTHSRIDSLFNIFGLSNRLFKVDLYSEIERDVDYSYTNKVLATMRADSIEFLSNCLLLSR